MHDEQAVEASTEEVTMQLAALAALSTDLQQGIETMAQKNAALDAYSAERSSQGEPDIEERLVPYDKLSVQMTKLSAEQAAIDDCMYYLELALASVMNPTFQTSEFLFHRYVAWC